jgi:glycosyltransferase involved in cell wall biosynthesis
MTKQPLVSVVIPTYERAKLTLQAVLSVLDQQYSEFEVIVVDDGSSEETQKQLESMLPAGVIFISLPHSGLPAVARNAGIASAKGEWIAFLDSDDIWNPDKLSKQMETALAGNFDCVSSNFLLDSGPGHPDSEIFKTLRVNLKTMLRSNQIVNSSVMVRKAVITAVGGVCASHNVRGVEDYATWLRILSKYKWAHIVEPLGTYSTSQLEGIKVSRESSHFGRIHALIDFMGWQHSQGSKLIAARLILRLFSQSLITIRKS